MMQARLYAKGAGDGYYSLTASPNWQGSSVRTEETAQELRTEWELIQSLKAITSEHGEADKMHEPAFGHGPVPTLSDAERMTVEAAIDKWRPEHTWREIADRLGTTKRTLFNIRERHDL